VVPADCRVLTAVGLQVDESALTGESFPVSKYNMPLDASAASAVADRTSMLYESTTVAAGRGTAVVVATGAATEVGRSMAATRDAAPPTGVEMRLSAITSTTLPIALGSAAAVVAAGLLRGRPVRDSLAAGVSLAVASVPEGLPFLVNAAQLASARRLSKLGALVRNPRTIEALGRVDTLCFDKTGTLTEGRISLAGVADPTGELLAVEQLTGRHRRILATALRATPRGRRGEPLAHLTDRAIAEGAEAAGVTRDEDLPGWRRLSTLPFEPGRGYHATLGHQVDAQIALLSVKGAPETVLPRCTQLQLDGHPDAGRRAAHPGRPPGRPARRARLPDPGGGAATRSPPPPARRRRRLRADPARFRGTGRPGPPGGRCIDSRAARRGSAHRHDHR
jgi:cation-transporting ATPase I